MKVKQITGTIETADGEKREFRIGADGGWSQWGAVTERLGDSCEALDVMAAALMENGILVSDDDEEDDEREGSES